MKKSRLLLSGFCLALALTLTAVPSTKVFADGGYPQGGSNSTKPVPPPPPSQDLIKLLQWLIHLIF